MSYYRLMASWLADQAGGLRVPLPVPPPMEFSSLPEHFVEDMDDLLIYVSRRAPKAFEGANLVRASRYHSSYARFGSPLCWLLVSLVVNSSGGSNFDPYTRSALKSFAPTVSRLVSSTTASFAKN